jgi:hypothetical protein
MHDERTYLRLFLRLNRNYALRHRPAGAVGFLLLGCAQPPTNLLRIAVATEVAAVQLTAPAADE